MLRQPKTSLWMRPKTTSRTIWLALRSPGPILIRIPRVWRLTG
ncbi:hypothetical protein ACFFX0_32700 [Citricoccus parietis]|uniref:Uncharacterized protein n=1 Tax=Citricoccus parietis TaxID=592307 RepID=A0ABV5G9P2_9MICC